jgi:release factor glutamine methyltransferase
VILDSLTSAKKIFQFFKESLSADYVTEEAESLSFLIAKEVVGISRIDIITNKELPHIPESVLMKSVNILERLNRHEPIQYILGETEFFGCKITVNPSVLIPRPETEEMVDVIIKENVQHGELTVLDICTGSGCIPIALAKNWPSSQCYALDISQEAINTARINAEINGALIQFSEVDILNSDIPWSEILFDIIISNPPYVLESEKAEMQKNVLDYEPSLALFVNDTDPLLFYRRIINVASGRLASKGKLYFEINEKFGQEVSQLMKEKNYTDIKVIKDLFGKDRFVTGSVG